MPLTRQYQSIMHFITALTDVRSAAVPTLKAAAHASLVATNNRASYSTAASESMGEEGAPRVSFGGKASNVIVDIDPTAAVRPEDKPHAAGKSLILRYVVVSLVSWSSR